LKKHIELVGILHIVYHSVGMIWAALVMFILAYGGLFARDQTALMVVLVVAMVISGLVVIFSIPGIIGGAALLKMKPWGRTLTLVMGFLALIEIPLGTALGVYTIWALMNDETIKLFEGAGESGAETGVS
jgi:hypothetical protein